MGGVEGPPSSAGFRAELMTPIEKITSYSVTRVKKDMLFPVSVSAPHENPRILEVFRLRPCFPAPLKMTAFFGPLRGFLPRAFRVAHL